MKPKAATIYDIAAHLSVSASTVSRALKGDPRVKPATRQRIERAATELKYRPNLAASSLRKGVTRTLGVIVPRIERQFFAQAISGIEAVAKEAGYQVVITQTNESYERERENLAALVASGVDGILLSLSMETPDHQHLQQLLTDGTPLVFFDRVDPKLRASKVVLDDYSGAYLAVEHLIEQGYRRIAHLGGPMHLNIYQRRYEGFADALAQHGLELRPDWVFQDNVVREQGEKRAAELFTTEKEPPDALFAASDYLALGALRYLNDQRFAVPEQVGLVGFANEPFTDLVDPGISSVEQFSTEMGRNAAQLLFDQIRADAQPPIIKTITVVPQLIVRASSNRLKLKPTTK